MLEEKAKLATKQVQAEKKKAAEEGDEEDEEGADEVPFPLSSHSDPSLPFHSHSLLSSL